MSAIVEAKNLKKYFKVSNGLLHAVDDVSFNICRGETMGVVGESGCGKSTLGRLLLRLIELDAGKVLFEGQDVTALSAKEMHQLRQRMQMIFQDPFSSLDPRMSVQETIAEPLRIYGLTHSDGEMQDRVEAMMETVGLSRRFAGSYPHELDGGRRQRIGIARALVLNPSFVVCDEPVSALDVSIQAQILNLMQDLKRDKGLTYLFITHDLSVVKHISESICVMYLGKIVEKCPTKALFQNPVHPYTQALLSAIPVPEIHVKRERILLHGELSSPINPKPGCRFAPRCIYATKRCREEDPVLREIEPDHFVACCMCEN